MPVRPFLQAVLVPALAIEARNELPYSWGVNSYLGAAALHIAGGFYTPQGLALALDQALEAARGAVGLRVYYRPVLSGLPADPVRHDLILRNRGTESFYLHANHEEFRLKAEGDVSLGVGPEAGSSQMTAPANSEIRLFRWPAAGPFPLRLAEEPYRFDNLDRSDALAETGRRYSWSGPPLSRLSARLQGVPVDASLRPPGWAYAGGLWRRPATGAPLSSVFGPRSAPLRGAPLFLHPDKSSRRFFFVKLDGKETSLQRRLHGFVDISFSALEQDEPAGESRRVGPASSDDFSGTLSRWTPSGNWQALLGELVVDTNAGASPTIVFNESLKDAECEVSLRFPVAPTASVSLIGGIGLDFGSSRQAGVGLEISLVAGAPLVRVVTWTNGAGVGGAGQVLAALSRAEPVRAPGARLRVQFFSNPLSDTLYNLLYVRAWVGEEGPFDGTMALGLPIPFLKNPILFYADGFSPTTVVKAKFDDFLAREFYWDSGPDTLRMEDLGAD